MRFTRYSFRKLKKLWLIYLFLLFFSFFMFVFTINLYIQNIQEWQTRRRNWEEHNKKLRGKGPQNVVAHYIGTGNLFGNLTKEEYNINEYNPVDHEGANGKPVIIPARENFRMQRLFGVNSFNILASDRIPLNRTLLDYRMDECKSKVYPNDLPSTSIIIVFHNEAWSVLLRTIWSVINRSPRHLLQEIILVDDASDRVYLKTQLEEYVMDLPVPTHIGRLSKRQGIVPARLLGAKMAKGHILTFLDAHCECSEGWLEPLLARIKENRKVVICPILDIISSDNFGYTRTIESNWGTFNWQLHFRWYVLAHNAMEEHMKNMSNPTPTPAMAGGLFSIERDYFYEMGAYDPDMKIWGGENVEMSFRIWQCGGRIEMHPCSHVGHVFRQKSPYTFPGGMSEVLSENLSRAALVWMDEYTDFFLMYSNNEKQIKNKLNVTERVQLRKRLNCKSFSWYLNEIWPSHFFPTEKRFFGKIVWLNDKTKLSSAYQEFVTEISVVKPPKTLPDLFDNLADYALSLLDNLSLNKDSCLRPNITDYVQDTIFSTTVIVGDCNPDVHLHDIFVFTPEGLIMTNENLCLDLMEHQDTKKSVKNQPSKHFRFFQCYDNVRQHWTYDIKTQQIRHKKWKTCLTVNDNSVKNGKYGIKMAACSKYPNILQMWGLIPLPWANL